MKKCDPANIGVVRVVIPEKTQAEKAKQLIANKIIEALHDQRMSKQKLADCLEVQPSVITKWTKGNHNFTVDTLVAIEEILNIKLLTYDTNRF